jgi:hypothetical protein
MPPLSSSLAAGLFLQGVPPLGLYDWRQRGMVLTPMAAWIHLGVVQICSPDARVQWVYFFRSGCLAKSPLWLLSKPKATLVIDNVVDSVIIL